MISALRSLPSLPPFLPSFLPSLPPLSPFPATTPPFAFGGGGGWKVMCWQTLFSLPPLPSSIGFFFSSSPSSPSTAAANQDGVRLEAGRAGAPADPAAPQGVPVSRHDHPEVRPASILYLLLHPPPPPPPPCCLHVGNSWARYSDVWWWWDQVQRI